MIGQIAASRPAYYDRNPVAIYQSYSTNVVSPAAITIRATYTVPTGKKTFVETVSLFGRRRTAATTPGTWSVGLNLTPNGGALTTIVYRRALLNAIDDRQEFQTSPFGEMGSGDKIDAITEDLGVAGTIDYTYIIKAVEFDA